MDEWLEWFEWAEKARRELRRVQIQSQIHMYTAWVIIVGVVAVLVVMSTGR